MTRLHIGRAWGGLGERLPGSPPREGDGLPTIAGTLGRGWPVVVDTGGRAPRAQGRCVELALDFIQWPWLGVQCLPHE